MLNFIHAFFLVNSCWFLYTTDQVFCIEVADDKIFEVADDDNVSWEPEGRYKYSKMFHCEPEGLYHCTMSMAIAPFWFSMDHLWTMIAPFWLSTDDKMISSMDVDMAIGITWIINIVFRAWNNFLRRQWLMCLPFFMIKTKRSHHRQMITFSPQFHDNSSIFIAWLMAIGD